jgi:hypothetical protein
LVEKYTFRNHLRKCAVLREILGEPQATRLDEIRSEFKIQMPDLFDYSRQDRSFRFAEVKGPGDVLRPIQKASHEAIRHRLGARVELIVVRQANPSPTAPCGGVETMM